MMRCRHSLEKHRCNRRELVVSKTRSSLVGRSYVWRNVSDVVHPTDWVFSASIPSGECVTSHSLKEVLRATLSEVQRCSELPQDEPALVELRSSLVRAIAELAVLRNDQAGPTIAEKATESL